MAQFAIITATAVLLVSATVVVHAIGTHALIRYLGRLPSMSRATSSRTRACCRSSDRRRFYCCCTSWRFSRSDRCQRPRAWCN